MTEKTSRKKILIIDDEESITRLLKFVLEKTGVYDVASENAGAKALSTIRELRPNLLILDMNMPGATGGEISAEIERDPSLRGLPIIFLTGNVTSDEVDSGLRISGHPAMSKPIDMDKLLQCIEKNIGP